MSNEPTERRDGIDDPDARDAQPARAEQPRDEGFAEGEADPAAHPEDEHVGDFAEGERDLTPTAEEEHVGRFSEGEEVLGEEDPEKHVEGRFSTGVDDLPPDADLEHPL